MPVIEQKTTNKNKVDFDLNRLDKSKTTIFSKYPKKVYYAIFGNVLAGTSCLQIGKLEFGKDIRKKLLRAAGLFTSFSDYTV